MKKLNYIKEFIFDVAQYRISDKNGSEATLKINYKANTYELISLGLVNNEDLLMEAQIVAEDLLKRKHGVNFANK